MPVYPHSTHSKTGARALKAAERRAKSVEWRKRGYGYREIARTLKEEFGIKCSATTVCRDVRQVMAELADYTSGATREPPRIGAGNHPYYVSRLRDWLPDAEILPMATSREIREYLKAGRDDLDAIMMPAEEASAWSVLFPAFDVAIPHPAILKVPLSYAMPQDAEELIDLVDTWITLKKSDQTIEELYDHWILGKRSGPSEPRWSVIRNVLGWVN